MLSTSGSVSLPLLKEEAVLTEKLDGGNCSIYRTKVGWALATYTKGHARYCHNYQLTIYKEENLANV